ncbi:MAG: branched-chain amino acid ABC transporter permease, partial [Actinomycetota bacterium]|nr:branched-chain amino acid ABC transporter permease [Actinomycetota bacterium]
MQAAELLQFVLAGLKNGSIYALLALGFTIVYASTSVINFAQGEFYMLGGMFGVFFFSSLHWPLWLAAIAAVVVTAGLGALFEVLAIRPRADADPLTLVIVTVGGSVLLKSLARHVFGPDELVLPLFSAGDSFKFAGAALERQAVWIWVITLAAVVALWALYSRTAFGRALRACAIDRDAARLVGIDTRKMVTASFALAAALGAAAGVAVTPITQTAFYVGASVGLKGFAAAILGGLGNPIAAVIGGVTLGLIE